MTYISTHGGELFLQFLHELKLCGDLLNLGNGIQLVFVQRYPRVQIVLQNGQFVLVGDESVCVCGGGGGGGGGHMFKNGV